MRHNQNNGRRFRGHNGGQQRHNHSGGNNSSGSNNGQRRVNPRVQTFDSNGPDVRIALAGVGHFTLASRDPHMDGANGYLVGTDVQYQMLKWFGLSLRAYGESRDAVVTTPYADGPVVRGKSDLRRWSVYSVSPGIAFRTNWQSTDRIELIYSRRFYSDTVDNNSAQPLDRDVVALGAYLDF
jgi:hypothetical protein